VNDDTRSAIASLGSDLERAFDTQFRVLADDLPPPRADYQFEPTRNWRFDRAWPEHKVAVELEGGAYGQRVVCHNCGSVVRAMTTGGPGREVRAAGWHGHYSRFVADREKYNAAALKGWIVLRFVNEDVLTDPFKMVETIRQGLASRPLATFVPEPLTGYQENILYLIAGGLYNHEIVERLGMTMQSVKKQTQAICGKLHAGNRASAVARGLVSEILDPGRIPWKWDDITLEEGRTIPTKGDRLP
jgi:DNA-binding CsgD family transcriptional regulator